MSKLDHLYVQLINDGWVADRPRLQIQLDGGGAAGQPIRFCGYTHRLAGAAQYPLSLYNPFRVETLIDRNLRLLDTCLTLRTQEQDYQKFADDAALAYALFQQLDNIDDQQDTYCQSNDVGVTTIATQHEIVQEADGKIHGSSDSPCGNQEPADSVTRFYKTTTAEDRCAASQA